MHFLLETVGEDVVRSSPRLFYNYSAVEKIAEGKTVTDALLLAERFAATSAFAHSLAFCQAVENICSVRVLVTCAATSRWRCANWSDCATMPGPLPPSANRQH